MNENTGDCPSETRHLFPLRPRAMWRLLLVVLLSSVASCGAIIDRQVADFSEGISAAVRNQSDPELVGESLPAYLLLTEGMIADRDDAAPDLHRSAAELYGAYLLVQPTKSDEVRRRRLTGTAFEHAKRAFCVSFAGLCPVETVTFERWQADIAESDPERVPVLFTLAVSWLALIEAESADWNRVAQVPRVKALLDTVVRLDEGYQDGLAHLYLGGLETLLPPALGGRPEIGRRHFERAETLSGGRNLMVKVVYAERYARLVFDRELHHRLLTDVLQSPAESEGYTLINTLAKKRAKTLLADESEYFL